MSRFDMCVEIDVSRIDLYVEKDVELTYVLEEIC